MTLTRRQSELLRFIHAYIQAHGMAPTLDEMRHAIGGNSRSCISGMLAKMEGARVIRLWTDRRAFYGPPTPDELALWARACGQCKACLAAWSLNPGEVMAA